MATNIVYNAKLRNTSICGATETILMHEKIVKKFCNPILKKLEDNNCKIYGDNFIKKNYSGTLYPAKEKDWSTEYLTAAVSVKVVKNLKQAIAHINRYGTMHTDSIITKNKKTATLSETIKGGLGKAKRMSLGKFKAGGKNPEGQSQIKGKTFTYG